MNKNNSSILKLVVLSGLIVSISIFHFLSYKYFDNKYTNAINTIKLLDRNNQIINEIILHCDNYFNSGNNQLKENIDAKISDYDYSFSVLITGGKIKILNEEIKVKAPPKEQFSQFQEIELLWNDLKIQIHSYIRSNEKILDASLKALKKTSSLLILKQSILNDEFVQKKDNYRFTISVIHILIVIIYFILLFIGYLYIKNRYFKFFKVITNLIKELTLGKKPDILQADTSPESSEFLNEFNHLNYKINDISKFVNRLLDDNYDIELSQFNPNDELELALVKLRNKLKENIDLNQIKLSEEQERLRFSEIQAKFNDILRESASNIKMLADASLVNLVKVFNASVGGFFILNDDTHPPYLELVSAFAYDRIKSLTKTVFPGDGLIGMCAVEKNTILLDKVPQGYLEIESGLGEASPENLLIIPLKSDENLLGIIEIASFNTFSKTEINFIENIAEDIASTLETTKISDRTNLLLEESQKKSDELAQRDSEMSDKIEQLREIQMETKKSEIEMSSLISGVDRILLKAELSMTGKIIDVNKLFITATQYNINELKNKSIFDIIENKSIQEINEIINKIKLNESEQTQLQLGTKQNNKISLRCIFTPVKDENDQIGRILFLAENTSYIDEITKKNNALLSEIENRNKIIREKEEELSKCVSEISGKEILGMVEINKIEEEQRIKKQFETKSEKKYHDWLNHIIK
jgi:putative methionine-R-sulfoxide reductase with GAF domain